MSVQTSDLVEVLIYGSFLPRRKAKARNQNFASRGRLNQKLKFSTRKMCHLDEDAEQTYPATSAPLAYRSSLKHF